MYEYLCQYCTRTVLKIITEKNELIQRTGTRTKFLCQYSYSTVQVHHSTRTSTVQYSDEYDLGIRTSTSTVRRRNPSRGIPVRVLVRVLYAYEYCTVVCRQAYRTAIERIEFPRLLYEYVLAGCARCTAV